jgi:rsbT co-antagonist protein RsbR
MVSFQTIGQFIVERNMELSAKVSKESEERYTLFLNQNELVDDAAVKWRAQFITHIGKAVLSQNEVQVFSQISEWATQTSEDAVNRGVRINELLKTLKLYRKVIWDCIEKEIEIDNIVSSSILKINRIIDALLDHTAYIFSVSYIKYSTKLLEAAQKAFNEVSFPVVALSDQVAILPLIGEMNEERADMLLENVLPNCTSLGIEELIVDLSGVPRIDTLAINQLFKLNASLDLIGISTTYTGIRPALAIPMVNLGICLNQLNVKGTLKNAISTRKIM